AAWAPGTTRARYTYVWSHTPDGGDGVVFFADKIHARHGYRWTHPVHEVLTPDRAESCVTIPELRVEHWPDSSKSRGQYLPLLELSVAEDPGDDRNMHYLGREYMFHQMWGKAIETLMRHLAMPTATWAAERAASMRYIARCCDALGDWQSAVHWLERAADEAPGQREAPYALSLLYYRREDWALCRYWAMRTLHITARDNNYMTEPEAWGAGPFDLMAISSWQLGQWEDAVAAAEKAVELEPGNERLQNNLKIMRCSHDSKSK
uniref:tetratricopeptide repeat protein n=1 Tax=Candidatus Scatomorpha intestinigallinarum TaxID=2840923 RepID=UPI0040257CB2